MPKITYIEHGGKSHTIEVSNGLSVMEGAVQKNIPGIDADCGGSMACATCHVYVNPSDFENLKAIEEDEISTLKEAANKPTTHSRLGCQVKLIKEYNNITVTIAPD